MAESREELIARVARETGELESDVRDVLEAIECVNEEEDIERQATEAENREELEGGHC